MFKLVRTEVLNKVVEMLEEEPNTTKTGAKFLVATDTVKGFEQLRPHEKKCINNAISSKVTAFKSIQKTKKGLPNNEKEQESKKKEENKEEEVGTGEEGKKERCNNQEC